MSYTGTYRPSNFKIVPFNIFLNVEAIFNKNMF